MFFTIAQPSCEGNWWECVSIDTWVQVSGTILGVMIASFLGTGTAILAARYSFRLNKEEEEIEKTSDFLRMLYGVMPDLRDCVDQAGVVVKVIAKERQEQESIIRTFYVASTMFDSDFEKVEKSIDLSLATNEFYLPLVDLYDKLKKFNELTIGTAEDFMNLIKAGKEEKIKITEMFEREILQLEKEINDDWKTLKDRINAKQEEIKKRVN